MRKRYRPRFVSESRPSFPTLSTFSTESLEQARFVIRRVVDSGYGTIVTGGGMALSRTSSTKRSSAGNRRVYPLSTLCSSSPGYRKRDRRLPRASHFEHDLQSLDTATVRWLDLIKVGDHHRATFGGFGWDAHILNNYDTMRKVAEKFGPSRALFKTVGGYLVAGLGKSVPEFMIHRPSWKVRVINTGGMGFEINTAGEVVGRIPPGAKAFEGEIKMACYGTTPYYGYKMNMMPHASKTSGMFQLRLRYASAFGGRHSAEGLARHPGASRAARLSLCVSARIRKPMSHANCWRCGRATKRCQPQGRPAHSLQYLSGVTYCFISARPLGINWLGGQHPSPHLTELSNAFSCAKHGHSSGGEHEVIFE